MRRSFDLLIGLLVAGALVAPAAAQDEGHKSVDDGARVLSNPVGSTDRESPRGHWLPPPTGVISRVAFGSCAKQWQAQPIWDAVVASDPDLFLFLGDAIYGDWDGEKAIEVTRESLAGEWARLAGRPEFQRLRDSVPVMATWNNHDFGKHDGGVAFPLKNDSRELFLDFLGEPNGSERRSRDGLYDAKIFGPPGRRLQVILLDTRWFKGPFELDSRSKGEKMAAGLVGSMGKYAPNDDPDVTLLGEAQWLWLEEQLREPAKVRLVCSSTQVIADQKGMDEWGNYPLERQRMFDLVSKTRASRVILLSGNVHFAEISATEERPYRIVEFTSSGLTHVNEEYAKAPNRHRVAGPFVATNFGLVEIDWGAETVKLTASGVEGRPAFEYSVSLVAMTPRAAAGQR